MTRLQRNSLAIAIVVLAGILHFGLCEWHWKARTGIRAFIVARVDANHAYSGLTAAENVDYSTALVQGVVLPLAMIVGDVVWMLGWQSRARRAAGCCVSCGYNLKGSPAANCPECGATTPSA